MCCTYPNDASKEPQGIPCSQDHLFLTLFLMMWNTHAQVALGACFDRLYVPPVLHHLQFSPKFVVSSLLVFSVHSHPFPGGKQHLNTKNLATCISATWKSAFISGGRRAEPSIGNNNKNPSVSEQCCRKLGSSSKWSVTDKSSKGFASTTCKTWLQHAQTYGEAIVNAAGVWGITAQLSGGTRPTSILQATIHLIYVR